MHAFLSICNSLSAKSIIIVIAFWRAYFAVVVKTVKTKWPTKQSVIAKYITTLNFTHIFLPLFFRRGKLSR